MMWFGLAWAVVYAILIGIEVLAGMGFGDWPYGLAPFLVLVPYAGVLRSLARSDRARRGPLRAWLVAMVAVMILLIFRWAAVASVLRWWPSLQAR